MIGQLKEFPEISANIFDLREIKSMKELNVLLDPLVKNEHLLLHGTSNRIDVYVEPRQANDDYRESGNQRAVYATNLPERAIFHAIIDKSYLHTRFDDFTTGYSKYDDDILEFEFTKNVKDLLDAGDQKVFCDGYIHVLGDATFEYSEGDDSEYQSAEPVQPLFSLLISKDLGNDVKMRSRVYNPDKFK